MLDISYRHQDELKKEYTNAITSPRNEFFNSSDYYQYLLKVDDDSWNRLQYVSVIGEKVNGYICADIDRNINAISNISILRFHKSISFSIDVLKFVELLFNRFRFNKIVWRCIVGNPAEKIYDKFIEKYGGRVVGIFREDVRTIDGKLRDQKYYELEKKNLIVRIKK